MQSHPLHSPLQSQSRFSIVTPISPETPFSGVQCTFYGRIFINNLQLWSHYSSQIIEHSMQTLASSGERHGLPLVLCGTRYPAPDQLNSEVLRVKPIECSRPGLRVTACSPRFAVSTHTMDVHSSSPKSGRDRALSIQGFHTTTS